MLPSIRLVFCGGPRAGHRHAAPARTRSRATVGVEILEDRQLLSGGGVNSPPADSHGALSRDAIPIQERRVHDHDLAQLQRDFHRFAQQFARSLGNSHVTLHQVAELNRTEKQVVASWGKGTGQQIRAQMVQGTLSPTGLLETFERLKHDAFHADDAAFGAILHGWYSDDQWLRSHLRQRSIQALSDMGIPQADIDRYLNALRDFARSDGISHAAYERLVPFVDQVIADQRAMIADGSPYPGRFAMNEVVTNHLVMFVHDR